MNWRTTLWLVGVAVFAALFVVTIERPARLSRDRAIAAQRLLPSFQPNTTRTLRSQTAQGTVTLVRTNGLWEIQGAPRRLAHQALTEELLNRIAQLQGRSILSTSELRARPQAPGDFGLNPPAATLTLETPTSRIELLLGLRSLNGSQVYYQITGVPGIFATDAELLDHVPTTLDGWRDTTLLPLDRLVFDRVRVVSPGGAFALSRNATNGLWDMTEPRPARADSVRVGVLLRQLGLQQVTKFFPPSNTPPAEVAGLRPAQLSLSLARGSNEVYSIAFGTPITNAPAPSVYALRPGESDTLAVPAEAHDLLRVSYKDLLDRRLVRFDRGTVREIAFTGPENFQVVWKNDAWQLTPSNLRADPQLVERVFNQLAMLEMIDIAKEVVTDLDLATYGLAPPSIRITLRSEPGNTNAVLAQLETGALRENRTFARVPGEQPVYLVNPGDLDELPKQAWELRDRSLWRFDSPQVASLSLQLEGIEWSLRHQGTNDWAVPPGVRNDLNVFALDEALHRLGDARIIAWRGLGPARAAGLGIGKGPEVSLEFRGQPAPPPLKLRFGKPAPGGRRYASLTLPDGTQPVFEVAGNLLEDLWRESGMSAQAPINTQ